MTSLASILGKSSSLVESIWGLHLTKATSAGWHIHVNDGNNLIREVSAKVVPQKEDFGKAFSLTVTEVILQETQRYAGIPPRCWVSKKIRSCQSHCVLSSSLGPFG
ncbi:unnamed protein product, partial [Aphanomyces euteiches]